MAVAMMVVQPDTYFRSGGFAWTKGSDAAAATALGRGDSVLLPDQVAKKIHAHTGDRILINTLAGPRPFTVSGLYVALVRDAALVVGEVDGPRTLGTGHPPTEIDVYVKPGVVPAALEARLVSQLERPGVAFFPELGATDRADNLRATDRFTSIYAAILGVALVIGMLGLANTLAMSVIERHREIGVLRAIGTYRRTVGSLVVVEAATLTAVAYALGIPLGALLGAILMRSLGVSFGFTPHFLFPWSTLPALGVVGAIVAIAAAALPARRAAAIDPVSALRFE
jgi:putative ABC transport system permease protein